MFRLDHLAFPCFDVPATVRFATDILGGTLCHAQTGPAEVWNARAYLLLAFELPGGVVVDFFSFDGIQRPTGGNLPKDIGHVAFAVDTRADVVRFREHLERHGVPFWLETHDVDDVHVYTTDPNGITFEILAREDGTTARRSDPPAAREVLARWLAASRAPA